MRRTITTLALTGFLCIGGAASALAASNPSPTGTGPPNQSCQSFEVPGTGANAPGHAGTSQGSVFNEPGFGSTNGGTGGAAYGTNNPSHGGAGAPSQYDVACYQVNQPHP
jgi:hypothetical protein